MPFFVILGEIANADRHARLWLQLMASREERVKADPQIVGHISLL